MRGWPRSAPAPRAALREHGVIADVVPERFIAEGLVEALADVPLTRALIARAAQARDVLPDALRERGVEVDVVALYETVAEPMSERQREAVAGADYVTFTSSSTVRFLFGSLDRDALDRAAPGQHRAGHQPDPARAWPRAPMSRPPATTSTGWSTRSWKMRVRGSPPGGSRGEMPSTRQESPVITFLSDYGLADDFVGICHGVIATACPQARIIDLTHGIARHDVRSGAILLAEAIPYVPVGVHLAVVDPDVGAQRRAVALRTGDGRRFVGPDNGLLSVAAEAAGGIVEVVDIAQSSFRLKPVSATFHGRDIFAPIAAALAGGRTLTEAGTPIDAADLVVVNSRRPRSATGLWWPTCVTSTASAISSSTCATRISASRA